jgi:hypothetical protein
MSTDRLSGKDLKKVHALYLAILRLRHRYEKRGITFTENKENNNYEPKE